MRKSIFMLIVSIFVVLMSEVYGQETDKEWIFVVREQNIMKADLDEILKGIEESCLSGKKFTTVQYEDYEDKLQEYKDKNVLVVDVCYAYGGFDINMRTAKIETIDGEYAEVPLPMSPSINRITDYDKDSVLKMISSCKIGIEDMYDMKLSFSAPTLVFLNRVFTSSFIVSNEGNKPDDESVISSEFPKSFEYLFSSPAGIFLPRKDKETSLIKWQIDNLGPQQSGTFQVVYRVKVPGTFSCTAQLVSKEEKWESKQEQTQIKVMGIPAMHISTYDTEDPVEVGSQTIYVIEARNEGTSLCTDVKIVDTIPDEMAYVSASPAPVNVEGNRIVFPTMAKLEAGEKITIKVVCKAMKTGSAKNVAELKYAEFSDSILDEEGTSVYE